MALTPTTLTRSTSAGDKDAFNRQMRSEPWYREFLARQGFTSGPVNLDSRQREALLNELALRGVRLSDGAKIDEAGNVNEKNRLGRNLVIGAGIGAGALLAGPAILGALGSGGAAAAPAAAGSVLPSTAVGAVGALPAAGASFGAAGAAGAAGGAGSLLGGVGSRLGSLGGILDAGGRMVGAATETAANNRGEALDAAMRGDMTQLAARGDQREGERDALKKLEQTRYIQNWQPQTSSIPNLPTFGSAAQAPSDAQRTGASTLEQELLRRLREGQFKPTDVAGMSRPGTGERIGNYLSPALALGSAYFGR